jgi:HK97 family phage major capsid protein
VSGDAEAWASRAAQGIQAMGGEHRAITSGTLDVPTLIEPTVTPMARPRRLIDLLVNRIMLDGNAFEFYKQIARVNNAAAVADNAVKPTSQFTVTPVQDRARVIAHLSEAAPKRLLQDIQGLQQWLWTELAEGVLDKLEQQVISGDGTGENMTGILSLAGTVGVAYTSSPVITLRKALTLSQLAGEQPNAIVLSPVDAEVIDMMRAGDDGPFLTGGFANDSGGFGGSSKNIFGDSSITRVISPSVPSGTAILGDWTKIAIYIRETVQVEVDMSGVLFTKNQFIARAEGRFGAGHLRPSSFFVADLNG